MTKHRSWTRILSGVAMATAALLLVPFLAMQAGFEVSWGAGDFLAAAALIFTAGMLLAGALRRWQRPLHRSLAAGCIVLATLLLWAELAVGIFD